MRLARGLGTDADGAVQQLAFWFNGYCFDGTSTCFNPFPVLSSLNAGCIMDRETAGGSSSINWLGLTPGDLMHSLVGELQRGATIGAAAAASFDIADLERRRVRAVPLLLQTGLLSRVPGKPLDCRPPNEYASTALRRMLIEAMDNDEGEDGITLALSALNTALALRSPAALAEAVKTILQCLPGVMFKDSKTAKGEVRESGYHAALAGALLAGAPRGVAVDLERASGGGRAGIVLRFGGEAAWVLEVGVGVDDGSKQRQAQVYGAAQLEASVLCCSVVVTMQGSASAVTAGCAAPIVITCAWSERVAERGGHTWRAL